MIANVEKVLQECLIVRGLETHLSFDICRYNYTMRWIRPLTRELVYERTFDVYDVSDECKLFDLISSIREELLWKF